MSSRVKPSIDGFVSRRAPIHHGGRLGVSDAGARASQGMIPGTPVGEVARRRVGLDQARVVKKQAAPQASGRPEKLPLANPVAVGLSRSDIDSSLSDIDTEEPTGGKKRGTRGRKPFKVVMRRIVTLLIVIAIAVGGYIGVKALIAGGKMFSGGLINLVQKAPLKEDANGRSNILIFGTSEDSQGGEHPGAELSDSIMMVSLDQGEGVASMVSVPRDFWVELDNPCDVGYEAKINTVYMCAAGESGDVQAGAQALQKKVGEVLGFEIHYYAQVNYKVLSDVVDAIGGVDVTIETEDPRGIYDPNFDWMCNHQCNLVKYANGEVAHLDGQRALALARARNAQGGYGLPGGNFDRERNQQKIIKAIQEKAVSAGTLSDVGKVTSLIEALGDNLKTNFETKEVRTLIDLAREIGGEKLTAVPLDTEGEAVVTVGDYYGQSIVRPVYGIYDYSDIHTYLRGKILNAGESSRQVTVSVYNASGITGLAQQVADELEMQGLTVFTVGNAPSGGDAVETYYYGDLSDAKTTRQVFSEMGMTQGRGDVYSLGIVDDGSDVKIVVGSSASQ